MMNWTLNIKNTLTKNQQLVLDVLIKANMPVSAYFVLYELTEFGLKAPPQVYRALDRLIELGKVHRIESMNAFIACEHTSCEASDLTAFTICKKCEKVSEIKDKELSDYMHLRAEKFGIHEPKTNIEFHGVCPECSKS
ncbi:transcriptional repressor [Alphaproteobacteria bacterium]|nr:transcriptional repressor [Alphaproteobacteria bacterium]